MLGWRLENTILLWHLPFKFRSLSPQSTSKTNRQAAFSHRPCAKKQGRNRDEIDVFCCKLHNIFCLVQCQVLAGQSFGQAKGEESALKSVAARNQEFHLIQF